MNVIHGKYGINIPLAIYLFCFMFAPPILPINFTFVLALYSIFMLVCFYNKEIWKVTVRSKIKNFSTLIFIYLAYIFAVMLMNFTWGEKVQTENYLVVFYQNLLVVPVMMVCIVYIIVRTNHLGFTHEQLLVHFIWAGMIEAVLALLAYLVPEIRSFFVSVMNAANGETISDFILSLRVYGFANGLYDLFGWGTGILASLPLFLSEERRKKYGYAIPLLLVSPLLNSRTGLIMFLVAFLIYLFCGENTNWIVWFKKVAQIILAAIAIYFVLMWLKVNSNRTYEWVVDGIEAFWVTITRTQSSDNQGLNVLFSERFWNFPPFPDIIFGTGHNIYLAEGYTHSDVGYINYLWMGGIFGSCMLYFIVARFFYKAIVRCNRKKDRWLLIFLELSFFIFNVKAQAFTHSSALACILTLIFYMIYKGTEEKSDTCS